MRETKKTRNSTFPWCEKCAAARLCSKKIAHDAPITMFIECVTAFVSMIDDRAFEKPFPPDIISDSCLFAELHDDKDRFICDLKKQIAREDWRVYPDVSEKKLGRRG